MIKNKKTKFAAQFILFLAVTAAILIFNQMVMAQMSPIDTALKQIGETTKLPSYEAGGHAQSSFYPGATGITSAILFVTDLLKYMLGTVAVIVIIFTGIKLITAGKKIDEVSTKTKESLKYAVIGLIVVMMADTLIKQVFYGESGEIYRATSDAKLAAQRGVEQMKGLYNFIEMFVGALAVLMIVIAGARLITAYSKTEEQITKARKQITWAIGGLILIGLSELLVKDIVFPKEGSTLPDVARATSLIINITNFVSSFIAAVSIGFIMYGGFMYSLAFGDQTKTQKAKKIVMGAVIGLIISIGAYAIVNSIIQFQPPLEIIGVGTQAVAGQ